MRWPSTYPNFAEEQWETLVHRLECFVDHMEINITPESFRENLQDLLESGFEPPPEKDWPPLLYELPYEAQEALRIFRVLPPAIVGMGAYIGRDLSLLNTFFELYEVPIISRRAVFELVMLLVDKSVESHNKKSK